MTDYGRVALRGLERLRVRCCEQVVKLPRITYKAAPVRFGPDYTRDRWPTTHSLSFDLGGSGVSLSQRPHIASTPGGVDDSFGTPNDFCLLPDYI